MEQIKNDFSAADLSYSQKPMASRIFNADISFVYDKLLMDRKIDDNDIPYLDYEFKKFILLAGLGVYPIAMISPLVDEVWHQFILFTKHYKEFCLNTVGHFIGHMPDTPKTPIPTIAGQNFKSNYHRYFGAIPPIWFKGMDAATINYYVQPILVGKPPKAWSGWAGPE
jgi:hypothetical protein